jgi:hypothetical protein
MVSNEYKDKIIKTSMKIGWGKSASFLGLTEKQLLNKLFMYNYHDYLNTYKNLELIETPIFNFYCYNNKTFIYYNRYSDTIYIRMDLLEHLTRCFNLTKHRSILIVWLKETYNIEGKNLSFNYTLPSPPSKYFKKYD